MFKSELNFNQQWICFRLPTHLVVLKKIKADWDVFKVITYHLLKNAVKHGNKGAKINFKLRFEQQSDGKLLLTVKITNPSEVVRTEEWKKHMQPLFAF